MKAAVSTTQTVCSHCEEVVHRYAVRCPYCHKNLKGHTAAQSDIAIPEPAPIKTESKITQMPQSAFFVEDLDEVAPKTEQIQEEIQENVQTDAAFSTEMKKIFIPLISLLTGSFFFFFGVILKLFSSNGTFTLEWNASAWPFFVFPAFVLLLVGMISLPKDTEASR